MKIKLINKKQYKSYTKKLRSVCADHRFKTIWLWASLAALVATTIYWSVLGAQVHSTNADQLIDGYLFKDGWLNGALFPSSHTMLLKWPLFWLVGRFGASGWALTAATVMLSVATVGGLAWLLWRIERRPLVLGTWFLLLACMLLLVPLQAYAGGTLPVQMAMLTTRNIEYIVYLISIVLLLQAEKWRTHRYAIGIGLMSLLIASDRLFIGIGLGGAALIAGYALLRRNKAILHMAAHLFVAQAIAVIIGTALVAGLQLGGLIANSGTVQASPYQIISSVQSVVLGIVYAVLGTATNFGANPAFDVLVVRDIAAAALRKLWSPAGLAYSVNIVAMVYLFRHSLRLVRSVPSGQKESRHHYPLTAQLSLTLVAGALAATGLFVLTDHYYAVDARYLTIWLFAVIITAVTALRVQRLDRLRVVAIGLVILVTIPFGIKTAQHTYSQQRAAYANVTARNMKVANILHEQRLTTLVGDYWRVVPIRSIAKDTLTVAPLASCSTYRDALTSNAWYKDLSQKRVALLVPIEKGLTDFPACSRQVMVSVFGQPSRTIVVEGTLAAPRELLFVYDRGFHHSVQLADLGTLPAPACDTKTIMQFAAHPDDDLLFFSPDLLHDIAAGNCIRTVYLTAGDSGGNADYWRGRQAGIEAAYDQMLGGGHAWKNQMVRLGGGQEVQLSTPVGNSNVQLVFMNLPDGNPAGKGYGNSNNESLSKLHGGKIDRIETINRNNTYASDELRVALMELMTHYQPAEVRTFAGLEPDHSDHIATAEYTREAWRLATDNGSIHAALETYLGYSVYRLNPNISDEDVAAKEMVFLKYTAHDSATCDSSSNCMTQTAYGTYLARQYRIE